jgi:low temperature requirement protein LtrA
MRTDREPSHRRLLPAAVSDEGHRVTRLELFFDLAYVFAFIQVTRLMAQEHDALGILQALSIVALLWWSWTPTPGSPTTPTPTRASSASRWSPR